MTEPTIHNAIGLAKHIQGMCADREDHALIREKGEELVSLLHELARQSEPTPELLEACKVWLLNNSDDMPVKGLAHERLAAFIEAREQAAREQWEEEIMGLRERIAKLVTENDRLEDHITLLSLAEPKEPRG